MNMKTRNLIASCAFVGLAITAQVGADQKDEAAAVLAGYRLALDGRGEIDPSILANLDSLVADGTTDPGALTEILRQLHPEFAKALAAASDSESDEGISLLEASSPRATTHTSLPRAPTISAGH